LYSSPILSRFLHFRFPASSNLTHAPDDGGKINAESLLTQAAFHMFLGFSQDPFHERAVSQYPLIGFLDGVMMSHCLHGGPPPGTANQTATC
jgi:hypothetical protein